MKSKVTKVRRRFGDDSDIDIEEQREAAEKDEHAGKRYPGTLKVAAGASAAAKKKADQAASRNTTKICTAVLNDEPTDTGPLGRKEAWKWCADNMKGKPFRSKLSQVAQDACVKPNGKTMARTACRKHILAAEGKTAVGVTLKLDKVVSKGPALVTRTVKGDELIPQTLGKAKKPCRESSGGGIRDCHYELEFFSADQAKQKKLPGPGPYIRVCSEGGKDGGLHKVTGPKQASEITAAHCCLKKGGSPEKCGNPGLPTGFGRAGRTSTNRFGLFGYKKGR